MSNLSESKGIDSPIHFKAGTVIFSQGKPSKYLYLIKRGEVLLLKTKGQGLSVVDLYKERQILNEVAILTHSNNQFSAVAKTEVELVLVDEKDVLSAVKSSPAWVSDIFETLCERLKHTEEMIDEHNLNTDQNSRFMLSKDDEKKYVQALAEFNS